MDKTYNVAIVGCGGISHMHAGWYVNEPRASLMAIADIDAERIKAYGEQYGVEKQYTDYIEMLETEDIDIVSVCTRPKLHAPVTIEVAKLGVKGILSEKPMAENLGQAREMLETCSEHGVKLAIDHQVRFSAPYEAARQMIADGVIGDIFRIHGVCGGGDLKDNATHTVDLMRYVYGDRPVAWVIGQIERIDTPMKYDLHPRISRSVTSSLKTTFGRSSNLGSDTASRLSPHLLLRNGKAKSNSRLPVGYLSVYGTQNRVAFGRHPNSLQKATPCET